MKILTQVTRYRCSHCKKEYERKYPCEQHEKRCTRNPVNFIGCHDCQFLEVITKQTTEDGYQEPARYSRAFHCNKKDIGMYPPSLIHKNVFKDRPDLFEDEIPMPNPGKCADKKYNDFYEW